MNTVPYPLLTLNRLGRFAIARLRRLGRYALFFLRSFLLMFSWPLQVNKILQQVYFIGMKSLLPLFHRGVPMKCWLCSGFTVPDIVQKKAILNSVSMTFLYQILSVFLNP